VSLKNPVTPPGIDPGTVRLVAQRLNHYATPGPKLHNEALHNLYSSLNTIVTRSRSVRSWGMQHAHGHKKFIWLQCKLTLKKHNVIHYAASKV
jgi:hypothetical protein